MTAEIDDTFGIFNNINKPRSYSTPVCPSSNAKFKTKTLSLASNWDSPTFLALNDGFLQGSSSGSEFSVWANKSLRDVSSLNKKSEESNQENESQRLDTKTEPAPEDPQKMTKTDTANLTQALNMNVDSNDSVFFSPVNAVPSVELENTKRLNFNNLSADSTDSGKG